MRPNAAKQWHPNFLIFNDSIVQESAGDARFRTLRRADNGGESRKGLRTVPLWTLELSNLQLSPEQYEEMVAFGWENQGMKKPFLIRNMRNCLFEHADGSPQLIGVGNGVQTQFQLIRTRPIQGRDGQTEIIYFPNFRYPDLYDWNGDEWEVLPELNIFRNSVQVLSGFDVNRTTGLITFDDAPAAGVQITVTGGFYILMVSNVDGTLPATAEGGVFMVANGVTFQEPEGGTAAELIKMELM
ncbi:hypothetical protein EON80_17590 [bacterium]|nr:MAG: hypothetical protein EON80_17590 [bacterium]